MNALSLRAARGFSLVELMVSVVIGLLALSFATRLVVDGETNKDAAIGGSDSMQNGMLALFSLSGDAGQAGWGLNDDNLSGCDTVMTDTQGYQMLDIGDGVTRPLASVVIQSNGADPDLISFNSGTSQTGIGSVKVIEDYTGGNKLTVDFPQPYGFNDGDVIVVTHDISKGAGGQCTLMQMSGFNQPSELNKMLINAGPNYRFNPTAGTAASFTGNASYAYNLGPAGALHFHTWSVNNGILLLRATDLPGASASPVAVVDNVVSIKAQYGFDTRAMLYYDPNPPSNAQPAAIYVNGQPAYRPPSGMQTTKWSSTMADTVQRIVAVRLAVVARSKTAEKPGKSGQCTATTVRPTVFGSETPAGVAPAPIQVNVAVAGDAVDWKCYRYRVFEMIVPIVNSQFKP